MIEDSRRSTREPSEPAAERQNEGQKAAAEPAPLLPSPGDFRTYTATSSDDGARVIPAVFGPTPIMDGDRLPVERAQYKPDAAGSADVRAIQQDIAGGRGWTESGAQAWKRVFSDLAGPGKDEATAGAGLKGLVGQMRDLDIYRIPGPNGEDRYFAGLVTPNNHAREAHVDWLKRARDQRGDGQPEPEKPATLTEIGQRPLDKGMATILEDARKGKDWSPESVKAWQDIFAKFNDPKADDTTLVTELEKVQDKLNQTLGEKRVWLDKYTGRDGTERYYASLGADPGSLGKIDMQLAARDAAERTGIRVPPLDVNITMFGTREMPAEYAPILKAARAEVSDGQSSRWDDDAKQAWAKAYEHFVGMPGATPQSVGNQLNSLGARINDSIGQDRVGMMALQGDDAGAWAMVLGRSSGERMGTMLGFMVPAKPGEAIELPPNALKLGPFVPAPKVPDRHI